MAKQVLRNCKPKLSLKERLSQYEAEKQLLQQQIMSYQEYQKKIIEIARRLKI